MPRMEKLARDKHSSLFCIFVSDTKKQHFHDIMTTGKCYKTFYICNLRMFVVSLFCVFVSDAKKKHFDDMVTWIVDTNEGSLDLTVDVSHSITIEMLQRLRE